jgi:hypothetical protein
MRYNLLRVDFMKDTRVLYIIVAFRYVMTDLKSQIFITTTHRRHRPAEHGDE